MYVIERKNEKHELQQVPLYNRMSMAVSTEIITLKQQFVIQQFDNWTQIDL